MMPELRRLPGRSAAPTKEGFHELVKVAVQDRSHIAGLVVGAKVLYELERRQHVAADLRAPSDLSLGAGHDRKLGYPFFARPLSEARSEDLHRPGLVLVLGTLVLAGDHETGRQVGDPHRRVGDVDMLAARAGAAEGVDAQVLLVDGHLAAQVLE